VLVRIRYELPSGVREQRTRVLVVRNRSSWWIASPEALNPRASIDGPPSKRELLKRYGLLRAEADKMGG
jgi:hypothetical protein